MESILGQYISNPFIIAVVVKSIYAILLMSSAWIVWFLITKLLKTLMTKNRIDSTVGSFLLLALRYTLTIITFMMILDKFGVHTKSLLAGLGVIGLGVGLASKDALSNIIAGLFILWDRPFVLGDLIEVAGYYGNVDKITLRTTRVITVDGKMLSIPNSTIVNSTVVSYTMFPHLRLDIEVTIGVWEDINHARNLILDLVKNDTRFIVNKTAEVIVKSLNSYNVCLELQVWLANERDHIPVRAELKEKVFNTLREAGVDMPFESTRIYQKQEVSFQDLKNDNS